MNLKAIFLFCGSILSLASEVTSDNRGWLITILSIILVASFFPVFVSLTEFFLSPRCKWRRFKYAFYELFLDEYFPLWETDWRLQGRSIYSHQGQGTTVHCLHDSHLVVAAMSSTPESNIVDIPSDTVKNLKISFLNKAFASNAFGWSAEYSLRHGGMSVLREYESALGYTYDVDLRPADPAGDHVFSQLQHEYVLMELQIDVGDLNVFFRFDRGGVFVPNCGNGGSSTTSITFKLKGNPQVLTFYKPRWDFREARRFIAYLAYWEERQCCGVLLTPPFKRGSVTPAIVLNVCTVQDLIDVAESEAPLTRFRAIYYCISEGESFWKGEQNAAVIAADAAARIRARRGAVKPTVNYGYPCVSCV